MTAKEGFLPPEGIHMAKVESILPDTINPTFGIIQDSSEADIPTRVADMQRRIADADPTKIVGYIIATLTKTDDPEKFRTNVEISGYNEDKIHLSNVIVTSLQRQLNMTDHTCDDDCDDDEGEQ